MNESDFLAIFQTELNGELQRATELALELEKAPDNLELINGLMREFHTIKGAARAIQFEEINIRVRDSMARILFSRIHSLCNLVV